MNTTYQTYSSIVDNILNTASSLTMINDFGNYHYTELNAITNLKYPYFLIYLDEMNFDIVSNMKTYNINVMIFDKLYDDKSNLHTIKNDCSEIMNEFLQVLKTKKEDYNIILEVSENAVLFEEKFSDLTAGIAQKITIKTNNKLNKCKIMTK